MMRTNNIGNNAMANSLRTFLLFVAAGISGTAALAGDIPDTPEHVVGDNPYPFDTVDKRVEEKEAIELPESVMPKLALLASEEIDFLISADAREFTGSLEDTVEKLEKRTPEETKAWVVAMMYVFDYNHYKEGRDAPNVAFNTNSPEFNAWKARRPRSMDPKREDGPLSLGRYDGRGGPPTFGGHPLALTPEDLIAGEVDVAILGAPLNMGSGWRDSGEQATVDLRLFGWPMGSLDQYVQIEAGDVLNIVDYGDVAIDNDSTERSMQHVREVVREIAETGAIPMIERAHDREQPVQGGERIGIRVLGHRTVALGEARGVREP